VATTDGRPSDDPAATRHVSAMDVLAVRGTTVERRPDRLAGEEPMAIRAAGPGEEPVDVAITMRTPGGEAELAVGFLRTEGLIAGREDVLRVDFGDPAITSQPDDEVIVRLTKPFDASSVAERHFVANASCGICGKASLDDVAVRCDPIPAGRPRVDRDVIVALPGRLRDAQAVFAATGGLHAAGLFDSDGRLITLREDVGRHNALDKLVGAELLAGRLPLHDRVMLVSGRISFEIAQKAAVAGIPILCAVSAPSDLAVEVGRRLGMTLIGFLRGDGFNVYSGVERIAGL
jgi:FdhD protein